jgi:hypothetical protein
MIILMIIIFVKSVDMKNVCETSEHRCFTESLEHNRMMFGTNCKSFLDEDEVRYSKDK